MSAVRFSNPSTMPPPRGYRWQLGGRGSGWSDICLRRSKCPYGLVRGQHVCARRIDP